MSSKQLKHLDQSDPSIQLQNSLNQIAKQQSLKSQNSVKENEGKSSNKSKSNRRAKRVSEYQASDDEMKDFENLESQLNRKDESSKNLSKYSTDKLINLAPPTTTEQDAKPPIATLANLNSLTKDLQKLQDKPDEKKKGFCARIFCCGGCCSKDNVKNEKKIEANLSKPEKRAPDQIKSQKGNKQSGNILNGVELEEIVEVANEEGNRKGSVEEEERQELNHGREDHSQQENEKLPSQENSIQISNKSGSDQIEKKNVSVSEDEMDQEEIKEEDMDSINDEDHEEQQNKKTSSKKNSSNKVFDSIQSLSEDQLNAKDQAEKSQEQSLEEEGNNEDDEDAKSDKTQERDDDQYKKAQSKRMFIIQEVDEDAFSDRSSIRREKSQIQQRLESSMQQEPKLEPLQEDNEEDKLDEENILTNQNVNNTFNDASQDIEPTQINSSIEIKNIQRTSADSQILNRNALNQKEMFMDSSIIRNKENEKKSKTWDEKVYEELEEFEDDKSKKKGPKSLINFKEYMDKEDQKQQQTKQQPLKLETKKEAKVEMVKQQNLNIRQKQNKKNNQKGSKNLTAESQNPFLQNDQMMILDEFDITQSQRIEQVSPFKDYNQLEKLSELLEIQKKNSVNKSKLTSTYYNNFDQFVAEETNDILSFELKNQQQQLIQELQEQNMMDQSKNEDNSKEQIIQTKQKAIQKIQERKSIQDQRKKQLMNQAKAQAKAKESDRKTKQSYAIKIQKCWKGLVQRKEYNVIKENLHSIKKLRSLFDKAFQVQKEGLLRELIQGVKGGQSKIQQEREELMNQFLNVCALNIQKAWRGHSYRKNKLPDLRKQRRAEVIIQAFIKAWRLRKVMQNKEIFIMRQHIKDLTKVQEYFVYIEKTNNFMLLRQLKKDRRRAIENFTSEIDNLQKDGLWLKEYMGNKIIENSSTGDSTEDGCGDKGITPIKDYDIYRGEGGELKELICTERFLYDDEIKRNPYLFETDEFVRQKYLERRYQAYSDIKVQNDEFTNMNIDSDLKKLRVIDGKNQLRSSQKKELDIGESESSRFESDSQGIKIKEHKNFKGQSGKRNRGELQTMKSENPRDKVQLPQNKLTFEEMLDQAIKDNGQGDSGNNAGMNKSKSQGQFLKKKDRYDPKQSIMKGKGNVSTKNINKKRLFGKNKDADREEEQQSMISQDDGYESRGTFKNIMRKSVIQQEDIPREARKTILPPSLSQKIQAQYQKAQMFLRSNTGKSNENPQQKYNKQQKQDEVVLSLEELEKIYTSYHGDGKENDFLKNKKIKRVQDSKIPFLKHKALFFNCYDDSVFDSVKDDLKREYINSTKDKKKWMLKQYQ